MADASSSPAVTTSDSVAKGMNDGESNKEQKDGEMKSTGGGGRGGDVPTESAEATAAATATDADEEAMATTATTSMIDSMMPKSQLPQIWSYFLQKLDRIDELERRVVERTRKSRRRILNGLEQRQVWQKYRRSHVRLFVTHHFQRKTGIWTLVLEGKLLIGNLDHQNANLVDTKGVMTQRTSTSSSSSQEESSNDENNNKNGDDGPPASKKAKTEDGDKEGAEKSSSETLTPYTVAANEAMARHSQSIEEEPTNIEPLLFTHMFEKFEVTFRTIYQPRTAANTPEEPKKVLSKKERKKQKLNKMMGMQDGVDPKDLRASEPIKVEWFRSGQPPPPPKDETKEESDPKTTSLTNNQPKTPDAHSFFVKYNNHFSERPPPPNMKFFSVVADIKLYPKRPSPDDDTEAFYQVSKMLAEKFFETW